MRFDVPERETEQVTVVVQLTPTLNKMLDAMHEVAQARQPNITREETAAYVLKMALPLLSAEKKGPKEKPAPPAKPNGTRPPQSAAKP